MHAILNYLSTFERFNCDIKRKSWSCTNHQMCHFVRHRLMQTTQFEPLTSLSSLLIDLCTNWPIIEQPSKLAKKFEKISPNNVKVLKITGRKFNLWDESPCWLSSPSRLLVVFVVVVGSVMDCAWFLDSTTFNSHQPKKPNVKTYLICIRSCAWCFRLCFIHFGCSSIYREQAGNTSKAGLYGLVG